jgi:ABC-type polysaccharide/polyol phosphate transport system ATPase subunit
MASIVLDRASLTFHVRQQRQITFKEYLLKGMFRTSVNPILEIHAVRDLSLKINDGERVGVLGSNGSGKSTLLRLLAGVYQPTKGRRHVYGEISSLFDLSLGFEMEANGWKNIRLRGFLQGQSVESIRHKTPEIADFSELGEFLNLPTRYYSSGMMVRLGFSVSTTIEPEILLIDEVLGAGDLSFQKKAHQRMREMMRHARILVVVSHDLGTLRKLCTRGLWLDRGHLQADGPIDDVVDAYIERIEGRKPVRV